MPETELIPVFIHLRFSKFLENYITNFSLELNESSLEFSSEFKGPNDHQDQTKGHWILGELSSIHSLNIFLSNGDKIFIPVSSGIVYKVFIEFSIRLNYITVIKIINDILLQSSLHTRTK